MTVSPDLVAQLLDEQAPEFAGLTPRLSRTPGSSNWVFRIGNRHAVRLPRDDTYAADLRKEAHWLPRLAPHLPVPVPDVSFVGAPSPLFPRPWSIVSWIAGDAPRDLDADAQARCARDLGRFLRSLHTIETDGLRAGAQRWGYRAGEPVTDTIDAWADAAADRLAELFDPAQVREAWRRLRDVPPATRRPCWIHTDLSSENLLVGAAGELVGVIDFGGLGVGDRAVDLLYAWELFDKPARDVLRAAANVDDATWSRARAWAFVGPGLVTIAEYRHLLPERTARLVRMIEAVAADVGIALR